VGVVLKDKKKLFGIGQDVEVRPSVDFTKLEEVLIVTQNNIEVLETPAPAVPEKKAVK